jgi:protease II
MRTASGLALCAALAGCAASTLAPAPRPPSATPALTAAPVPAGEPSAAASAAYAGHGLGSLSAEVLEKYRPKPLPSDVSRHIQAMLDVSGPGIGAVTPDGARLLFSWSVTGVSQLWRLDGAMRFPAQLTGGEDPTALAGLTPNGRWLVVSRDRKGEENPGLYLQTPEGGPLIEIQHKPGIQTLMGVLSLDSRFVYFTSNDIQKDSYAVYRYDIEKRARETLVDTPGLWRIADLADDGRLLLHKATGALTAEVWEWDPKSRALAPRIGQNEKQEYVAAYASQRDELLVRTNKHGEYRRLYRLSKGQLVPVSEDVAFDVAAYAIDRARKRILYSINENGFTRPRVRDARTYRPVALPKLPEADHVFFGPTTPDGRYTTLGVDDGRRPLQAFVLDWAQGRLVRWHAPSTPEIDSTKFARTVLEHYPARDGTKIPVLVRRPERCASQPCAVVIHFHGGPEVQAKPGFSVQAQLFVDAGFVYAQPNVRGSNGFGKSWLAADDGPKRLAIITDIEDAARWARRTFAEGGNEPRVGIFGGSYGGYSVLMGMTMFAGAYDAGVDIVGISDLRTFLRNTAPYRRMLRITEYGDPEKDAEALAKLSPITYIDRVKAPLLILQGATDPRVPAGEAVQIHEAFAKRGIPSELMIFPDEGHGAQKRENRVLMTGHAIAFLKKHLLRAP